VHEQHHASRHVLFAGEQVRGGFLPHENAHFLSRVAGDGRHVRDAVIGGYECGVALRRGACGEGADQHAAGGELRGIHERLLREMTADDKPEV
jgi:hypothetical protein